MRIVMTQHRHVYQKIRDLNWTFVGTVSFLVFIGLAILYSAAGGNFLTWGLPQFMRYVIGLGLMVGIALVDPRIWLRSAYAFYAITFVLLVFVELKGHIGMGAQRWIDLGFMKFQPSEVMKIALLLVLARYFRHVSPHALSNPYYFMPPLVLILAPVGLVMKQPDLGTALVLLMSSGIIIFVVGLKWHYVVGALTLAVGAVPVGWNFLHDYQKKRVLTFLNPESDPLGAGYHVMQSKIALGSGGFTGKGFLNGSQAYLNFLPEKQTDFIFTMFCEEFGFLGGLLLIITYGFLLLQGYSITLRCRHFFGRVLGVGIVSSLFIYMFINMGMVMGILPVVGVPLPLVSYGGTALIALMMGFGFLLSIDLHPELGYGKIE